MPFVPTPFSAIQALVSLSPNQQVNSLLLKIKNGLKEFIQFSWPNREIVFIWIPSHQEVEGNEIADNAAKEVISYIQTENNYIPYTDLSHQDT